MAIESIKNTVVDYNHSSTVAKDIQVPTKVFKDETMIKEPKDVKPIVDNTKQKNATEDEILDAIVKANTTLRQKRTRCEFVFHKEVNRISIKVLDKNTSEVIREIPAEDSLKVLEKIQEIAGLIIDEKL